MENNSKVIIAALAGAVIGAGVALLIAPASGKETRGMIADKFNDAKDAIGDAKDNLKDRFRDAKDNIKDKSEELLKKASQKS